MDDEGIILRMKGDIENSWIIQKVNNKINNNIKMYNLKCII